MRIIRAQIVIAAVLGLALISSTSSSAEAANPFGQRVGGAFDSAFLASSQEEEDIEAPTLDEFGFTPAKINVHSGAEVVFTAHISDDVSGVAYAYMKLRSPNGKIQKQEPLFRITGDSQSGTYRGEVYFEEMDENGPWSVSVFIFDQAGNEREIETPQLQEAGFQSELAIEGGLEPDTEGPSVDELSIEPDRFNNSMYQFVTVIAHITDGISGVSGEQTLLFRAPNGETIGAQMTRISGNSKSGTYETSIFFEEFLEPGFWGVILTAFDRAGNATTIESAQLKEAGLPAGVIIESSSEPPVVTSIEPASGSEAGGTAIQIAGSGFMAASQVEFGSAPATKFTVNSPTSITAVAPPGTGTVDVTVTTPVGTSATSPADHFGYSPPVTLTSSPNPSAHGQKITFTAKVTPLAKGAPTPLGTIAFIEGSTTLKVANLSKGTATFSTTALGAGKHPVVALYSGDTNFAAGESEALTQVVSKAATQLTLTSSLNPAPYGSGATLKATVGAIAPGAGTPAGTVTFREGETVLGIVQLVGANASLSLKTTPPGTHEITASYSGDANDEPSEAGPLAQTVIKATTETALTSSLNPAPYGSSATLKASVKALAPALGTPTGLVTFREGETVLASVPLSGGSAKYALKTTPPGIYPITASYAGSAEYTASEGSIEQQITKAATELNLTSSKNPAPKGSSGTLRATVKALAPGGGTPGGSVVFREEEIVLAVIPLSGSLATYPLKSLPAGTHEITASYGGSASYEVSEGSITQVISP